MATLKPNFTARRLDPQAAADIRLGLSNVLNLPRLRRRRSLLLPLQLRVKCRAVVLVAEDEASLRSTMCAFLTLKNFFPLGAENVEAALKILGAEHVDAIVLDIRLPDPTGRHGSGLNLLKFLRATTEYARVPVIILTGRPLSPADRETVLVHRAHVFYKAQPYTVLFDSLSRLLDESTSG